MSRTQGAFHRWVDALIGIGILAWVCIDFPRVARQRARQRVENYRRRTGALI